MAEQPRTSSPRTSSPLAPLLVAWASAIAASCVGKMHFQGGAYSGVKAALVFPSHLSRAEVMERIAVIGA